LGDTIVFNTSDAWKAAYPEASVGVLVMGDVANPRHHPGLTVAKGELEEQLRSRFQGWDRPALKALPTLQAYTTYYKPFRKTYHVQHQLESIVLKGKGIPEVAALVEAMFMAELKNLLLTAGHDVKALHLPVRIDVADGSEQYIRLNGMEQQLKKDDMFIADTEGIMSSILYGPDSRTRITPDTRRAMFTVYAPSGISSEDVYSHLHDIRSNVELVAPNSSVELLHVYEAD
jgi:DNA/RNA-binding domain of Phe-tRNA-synthetase-like protein